MENENITRAISAHGQWKERLAHAIWSGASDFNPDVVKLPDRCELGAWLYGKDIAAEAKASVYYQEAVDVHAKFHVEAGTVLSLALRGDMATAEKLMAPGSAFADLSATLIEVLNEWKAAA
jgi:hypothetical protein